MTTLSKFDISNIFSAHTSNLINKGYIVYPYFSDRHSDEINHIDFIHPKHKNTVIRVWLIKSVYHDNDYCFDTLKVAVKSYSLLKVNNIIWYEDGDLITEQTFYTIKQNEYYSNSLKDTKNIYNLRSNRNDVKVYLKSPSVKFIEINKLPKSVRDSIMDKVHSVYGAKRATIDCIESIRMHQHYLKDKRICTVKWTYKTRQGYIEFT